MSKKLKKVVPHLAPGPDFGYTQLSYLFFLLTFVTEAEQQIRAKAGASTGGSVTWRIVHKAAAVAKDKTTTRTYKEESEAVRA